MKVRIVEPALSNYTGKMYEIGFTDGVSDRDLSEREVEIIGASMKVEDLEGHQVGAGVKHIQNRRVILGDAVQINLDISEGVNEMIGFETLGELPFGEGIVLVDGPSYTREQLESIADDQGISGLREIAEPMGVTGRSIVELIDRILEAQSLILSDSPSS